jgi:hypothetical protein
MKRNSLFARREVDDPGKDPRETDRHDCPACHGTWIRMVTHDRTGIALRCVRCGCRFTLAAGRGERRGANLSKVRLKPDTTYDPKSG